MTFDKRKAQEIAASISGGYMQVGNQVVFFQGRKSLLLNETSLDYISAVKHWHDFEVLGEAIELINEIRNTTECPLVWSTTSTASQLNFLMVPDIINNYLLQVSYLPGKKLWGIVRGGTLVAKGSALSILRTYIEQQNFQKRRSSETV